MDQTLARRVAKLHQKALTVDAHFDLPYDVANRRERGARRVIDTHYLQGFKSGGCDLIVSSIFIHDFFLPEMGLRKALDQISYLHEELEESPDTLCLCRTCKEIRGARKAGKIALVLSLEGADPLQNDLQLLRIFYELGVRVLGLVWSRRNYAGDGSSFKQLPSGRQGGLTAFGLQLIERAEALGMVLDVSHINDEGFQDVMQTAKGPVIASHSNCRALAGITRNLTDAQIEAVAQKDGVIGVNALSSLIQNPPKKNTSVSELLDHVEHIVKVAGIRHVGLGLDLCDSFKNYLSLKSALSTRDVIQGHGSLQELTAGLIQRGYSDADILRVLGANFMRVFEAVLR